VSSDPKYGTEEYRTYLQILDWKLRNISENDTSKSNEFDGQPAFNMAVELHRLSTLIYLRRASAGILKLDQSFQDWVEQAFELLAHLPTCQWPLPLLIFGLEAQEDEKRAIMLDLMDRTMEDGRYRNTATVKKIIELAWVQEDLAVDHLDYVHKLGVILSSTYRSVPAFI
jgi:hypothetical protein